MSILEPFVRKLEIHSALTAAERDALRSLSFRRRPMLAHAPLFDHGDATRYCCVLLEGYAFRYKLLPDGGRQILNVLMRGDSVGIERALFGRADHGVAMLTAGAVALIPAEALDALLQDHPGLTRALWSETLFNGSVEREWIVNIGRRDALGRIAHLLCELGVRHEQLGIGERTHFPLPLTQTHLADCAGLTAVHVNRVLQSLRGEHLIKSEQRRLTIEDWTGLSAAGSFDERYLRAERVHPAGRVHEPMQGEGAGGHAPATC